MGRQKEGQSAPAGQRDRACRPRAVQRCPWGRVLFRHGDKLIQSLPSPVPPGSSYQEQHKSLDRFHHRLCHQDGH